ncbi:MAG TPA: tetratricopeptide repeat protein, partial [Kofleriaceae bacterium]
QLGEAQRSFRAALELEADNPRVLALLGLSHFRAGEFTEARSLYEQLVERAPTDASHRLNLGLVYLKLNDADQAITALEESRALDPSQGRAVSYLGLAYARAGRYDEAYRAFLIAGQNELAIEIESNLPADERERIHAQLGRSPQGMIDAARAAEAGTAPRPRNPLSVSQGFVPPPEAQEAPRTRPPSAPPRRQSAPQISTDDAPGRHSESMQFVIPRAEAVPAPAASGDEASMISRAVAVATPTPAAATVRTKAGGIPPRPLSELATDELIRPDDGDEAIELGVGGALTIRVTERVMSRLDGVHITGGDLSYEPAMRRSRGHNTDEPFDHGGSPLHAVSGTGYLIAVPGKHAFTAVSLDDDILYLREDLVFAFEASLRWENGNVPGLRGKLPVVQFRGDGAIALRLRRPLTRVKLPAAGTVFVDAERLAGWIGRVIPRAVVPPPGGPMGAMCVECTGEGVVLVEPVDPDAASTAAPPVVADPPPEAPPAPPAEHQLSLESTFDPSGDTLDRLDEL